MSEIEYKCHICESQTDEEFVCDSCDEHYCEECMAKSSYMNWIEGSMCILCQEGNEMAKAEAYEAELEWERKRQEKRKIKNEKAKISRKTKKEERERIVREMPFPTSHKKFTDLTKEEVETIIKTFGYRAIKEKKYNNYNDSVLIGNKWLDKPEDVLVTDSGHIYQLSFNGLIIFYLKNGYLRSRVITINGYKANLISAYLLKLGLLYSKSVMSFDERMLVNFNNVFYGLTENGIKIFKDNLED